MSKRHLTKRELNDEIFSIIAMCNGFSEVGHIGGVKKDQMIKCLPHQIACKLIDLQELIIDCELESK